MEHQLWKAIVAVLGTLAKPPTPTRFDFSDADIVQVYYWSVLCDRPTRWACRKKNWPIHLRKRPLPSRALAQGAACSCRRVFAAARWSGLRRACLRTRFRLQHRLPTGPVTRVGDDPVGAHRGRAVYGKARPRDPVRSRPSYTACRYGHQGVVRAVLVRFPCGRRPRRSVAAACRGPARPGCRSPTPSARCGVGGGSRAFCRRPLARPLPQTPGRLAGDAPGHTRSHGLASPKLHKAS